MPNYDIDYNDKRFTQVTNEKNSALNDLGETYDEMINRSDSFYDAQIEASKDWADKQADIQQEKTDFAIEQIEQNKEQAQKDYIKEQSGAYVDWQKQSDDYGADAEKKASQGLKDTGYSESSQVSMYNTYQNRVATAREAYLRAVQNYDNSITEARLQNNSILAEIAAEALAKQLELALQGFQYKNSLISEKADRKLAIEQLYDNKWQNVLQQINTENALAEQVRQFNAQLAEEQRQHNAEVAYQNAALAEEKRQFNILHSGSGVQTSTSSGRGASNSNYSKNRSTTTGKTYSSKVSGSSGSVNSSKSSSGSIDMQSVLALGYGPISASKLSQLEDKGLVESYTSGGKIKFRKSAYALKQEMLLK